MRVGIDGIVLRGRDAGSLRYFEQLLSGLAALDSTNEYIAFVNHKILQLDEIHCNKNFRFQEIPLKRTVPGALRQQLYRSWHTLGELDLLHCPAFAPPLLFKGKTVTTVFDLTFEIYPQTMKWTGRLWWRLLGKKGIQKSNKIIALSESTKRDLCQYYHIPEEKIRVIYPCTRALFNPFADKTRASKYRLPDKYILYVGTLERRKNIASLIRAFALAKRAGTLDHALVLAGKRGWLYQDIFQTIEATGLKNQIILLDYVPDEDLPALYAGADLFVYLSRFEGFGLPVLEAMACGTPVLVSSASSLPEVVGNAGILVPPDDVERAASEMRRLLSDRELRNELADRGLQRAKYFSQERFIRQTLEVYEQAARTT